jgi:Domain of unknown function (DUF4234)
MGELIPVTGTDYEGKHRGPVKILGLMIITLGIYGIFWYYYMNKELAEIGKARGTDELGDSPGTSVLAVTLGALVVIPAIISYYHTWQRQNKAAELLGRPDVNFSPLGGLVCMYLIVGYCIMQSNQNKVLEAQAQIAPGTPAPPLPA